MFPYISCYLFVNIRNYAFLDHTILNHTIPTYAILKDVKKRLIGLLGDLQPLLRTLF